jgi:hypothetical protein
MDDHSSQNDNIKGDTMKKIFSVVLFTLMAVSITAFIAAAEPEAAPVKVQNQGQQPDILKADKTVLLLSIKLP